MSYNIGTLTSSISISDLQKIRNGDFDEIAKVYSLEVSKEGSVPLKRFPIRWDPTKGQMLLEAFSTISYPYRRHLPNLLLEGFGRELQLLAISLDAYVESGYQIPVSKIIHLASLGPIGSKLLKSARKALFKKKIEAIDYVSAPEDPRVEDLIKDLPLDDIDVVFNYRYMPLWEEDINDLEEYSQIPVKTSPSIVEEFKEALIDLLKNVKVTTEDNRNEILLSTSRSMCLDHGEKKFNFLRNQRNLKVDPNFNKSIGTARRTKIPVCPQSFRDAVILDWKSLNTVRFIEYRVRKIIDQMPYHNYTDDNIAFDDSTRRFYRYNYTYVCRDIKKEGLTKPRYLLKLMLEVLQTKDPLLSEFSDFYSSFFIEEFGRPERGHGLGMANALTTLMQIVITQMVNNHLAATGFSEVVTSLNYNDDNVTRVPNEIIDEFRDIEGEIMKGLGLLRADEKSFYSKLGYVYCERYISPFFPECNKKQVTSRRNLLFCFLYDFVYEVKEYLKSQVHNTYYSTYVEEIAQSFGYEFFPGEIRYPLTLGGWMPDTISGLSTAVIDLDNLEYDIRVYSMYEASKVNFLRFPIPERLLRKNKNKKSVFTSLFPGFTKEIQKYLPCGNYSELFYQYGLWREIPKLEFSFRRSIEERRKSIFKTRRERFPTLLDFQDELLRTRKFIFPEYFCVFKDPVFFCKDIRRDPYKQDTPIENYLSKLGVDFPVRSPFREEYSISQSSFKFSLRKDEFFCVVPEGDQEELMGVPFEPESFYSVDRFADNTAAFLLAHFKYHGRVPVLPEIEKNSKKEEVYGYFLSLEDYIDFANIKYDRWTVNLEEKIFALIREKSLDSEELEELIESSRIVEPINHNESSSDSESEISEEECERLRQLFRKRGAGKTLTVESLQAILLGKEDPDGYEYEEELSFLPVSVIRFYNHHDSLGGDKHNRLRVAFEKFLENDYLKNLLISCCKEGYLQDIGESLGIFIPSDTSSDLGVNLFDCDGT